MDKKYIVINDSIICATNNNENTLYVLYYDFDKPEILFVRDKKEFLEKFIKIEEYVEVKNNELLYNFITLFFGIFVFLLTSLYIRVLKVSEARNIIINKIHKRNIIDIYILYTILFKYDLCV